MNSEYIVVCIHFYKEYTLKIWNFTEFRIGYEFHQFREEIGVTNLGNEVVFVNLGKKLDIIIDISLIILEKRQKSS